MAILHGDSSYGMMKLLHTGACQANICRAYTSNPGNTQYIIMVADLLEVQEKTLSDAICERSH